ncbi:MAG: FHA domain-containing protein, partial [Microbacterium gubbeenense]
MTDEQGTETHAAWGAGNPHLIVASDEDRHTFSLTLDEVTIGSAAGSVLRLPDIDALHATIVHDERDEYVLTLHGEGEMNANPHAAGTHPGERSETLRTGASFTAG